MYHGCNRGNVSSATFRLVGIPSPHLRHPFLGQRPHPPPPNPSHRVSKVLRQRAGNDGQDPRLDAGQARALQLENICYFWGEARHIMVGEVGIGVTGMD